MPSETHARIEVDAATLGMDPPPVRCHLRALDVGDVWVLFLWSPEGALDELEAWASKHGTFTRQAQGSRGGRVLSLTTRSLPKAWQPWLATLDMGNIVLDPEGHALLRVRGSRSEIDAFLSRIGASGGTIQRLAPSQETGPRQILTDHQRQALRRAAALGYYEVPRKISLRELSEKLETSTGALSTLLRRAEARLIRHHLERFDRGIAEQNERGPRDDD